MGISYEVIEGAAREVLETAAGAKVGESQQLEQTGEETAELVGTLSFLGTLGGTLVVYCARTEALTIANGMLGVEGDELDTETICDAIGELVNQIAGTIKRCVTATGDELMLSPPIVVTGTPLSHHVRSKEKPFLMKLALPGGDFNVGLWPS